MEIMIGRDANTSQLRVSTGLQSKLLGAPGSVPNTVSRQHCTLTINEKGEYVLKNIKVQNTTYVNGMLIQSKVVTDSDTIELGPDRYRLDWNALRLFIPKTVDITHLKKICEEYDQEIMELKKNRERFQILRGVTGVLTPIALFAGGIYSFFNPGERGPQNIVYWTLLTIIVIIGASLFIKALKECGTFDEQIKKVQEKYMKKIVCPNCHKFLGFNGYSYIAQQYDACQHCKVKFKK